MDEYGLIAGKSVKFIADNVDEKINNGTIIGDARWAGIPHFQHAVKANKDRIRRLNKIMLLDSALIDEGENLNNREIARRALNDFLHVEAIIKRDIDGVFLVLYTKSPVLDELIKSHYRGDTINRYNGTINLLATNGYRASQMAKILETEYNMKNKESVQHNKKLDEDEVQRRVKEQGKIYKLLGQREELRSQIDNLNKKLDLVDKELNNFLLHDRNDDLDVISELTGEDTKTANSLMDEIDSIIGQRK